MSPQLLNIYMDSVVREIHAELLHRGLSMTSDDGREWSVNQLPFVKW